MSKEPRPLPQPGDRKPQEDGPPPMRLDCIPTAAELRQQSRERVKELEAALRHIEALATNHRVYNFTLVDIKRKCREVLR